VEGGVGWLPSVFPSYGVCCVLLQSSLESAVHALRDCRTRAKTVVDDGYRCAPVFSLPVSPLSPLCMPRARPAPAPRPLRARPAPAPPTRACAGCRPFALHKVLVLVRSGVTENHRMDAAVQLSRLCASREIEDLAISCRAIDVLVGT
jgi:hypothetical protein